MKQTLARYVLAISFVTLILSSILAVKKQEPFYTFYFLFAWWSYIGLADSWLYLKGGESVFIDRITNFLTFLVPFSVFLWFIFEAVNLRLQNWHYVGVPQALWVRWSGNFLAFGTVVPGIFITANLLDYYGIFRKNEFSQFFSEEFKKFTLILIMTAGFAMLALPMIFPKYFFPLLWGGFVLLLDPLNAVWKSKSLIQEWGQKNWNRTFQLCLAGLICGGLWELWNHWARAKWVYSVPLPDSLLKNFKIFEMPIFGFLGFPLFALECFVMTEFARNVREKVSPLAWRWIVFGALVFCLIVCWLMDQYTIKTW